MLNNYLCCVDPQSFKPPKEENIAKVLTRGQLSQAQTRGT